MLLMKSQKWGNWPILQVSQDTQCPKFFPKVSEKKNHPRLNKNLQTNLVLQKGPDVAATKENHLLFLETNVLKSMKQN